MSPIETKYDSLICRLLDMDYVAIELWKNYLVLEKGRSRIAVRVRRFK